MVQLKLCTTGSYCRTHYMVCSIRRLFHVIMFVTSQPKQIVRVQLALSDVSGLNSLLITPSNVYSHAIAWYMYMNPGRTVRVVDRFSLCPPSRVSAVSVLLETSISYGSTTFRVSLKVLYWRRMQILPRKRSHHPLARAHLNQHARKQYTKHRLYLRMVKAPVYDNLHCS